MKRKAPKLVKTLHQLRSNFILP